MEYSHDVHTSQYEFHNQQNSNGLLNQSMEMRTRSWIQEHQHQTQQQPNQPTGAQMDQTLFYGQQQQLQQPLQHQHQHQQQQNQQPQQPLQQHQSINQQSNQQSVSFNQQSNSPWFNQQTQQLQQHYQRPHQQSHQESYQQPQHQQPQQLYQQHQSTLQWTQLDSFNLNRIIDQSIVNHDLLLNSFQSQLINQQPQQYQQPHQQQVPLFPNQINRQRHDLLYYKQLQEQESQQIYHQQQRNHQQNHQQPQQPKSLPNKVLFKFILNLTKPEAEQYLVQIAQTPSLTSRIRLVENERKNLTVNLIETLHPTNQFQQPPEEYVFVSIELIIVKSAEDKAKKPDQAQEEDCLHVEEIEDEVKVVEVVEVENKNAEDRARKVAEIREVCVRVEEIDGKVEDKHAKLTRPSILIFSTSKDKEQVNGEKIVAEENAETNIETNVETIDETQNVESKLHDSQTLQTFSDQDVEFNDQSNTSIELDETVDEPKGEDLQVNKPERPSSPEALTIQNILPDSSSSLLCTEDMPISPFLDQIKIPLGHNDPVGSTLESSVPTDQIIDPSQVEPSGTETNCNDSDATEIDNETVNETTVSESNMKRTRTSSTVSISVPKKRKIKVESSKSPLQPTTSSSTKPKLQTKRKSSPKANLQRSKKHYHQSHLDLSSIIQSSVSSTANKRLTRSSTASLVQQKKQQQPKRGTRKGQNLKSNKLKRN